MAVTGSIINSSFYTIDFAAQNGFHGFLPLLSWTGIRLIYLYEHPSTRFPTHTSLSRRSRIGERHPVHAVTGISLPYGTRGCHLQCHQSFKLVYASVAVFMQRELARSVRRRRRGGAALYPSRRPSVLGVVGRSPSSPALMRSFSLLDR